MAVASSVPAPFAIQVADTELADLAERLRHTRYSPSVATQPWAAGVDESVLRPLVDHWRGGFVWREREHALNQVPQYLADIGGLRVHFAHLRADPVAVAPVVLTHGWPYSFVEMLRLAHRLAEPRRFGIEGPAFDVVVPSLPGYAFSEPFATGPFTARRVAGLWRSLMVDTLGHDRVPHLRRGRGDKGERHARRGTPGVGRRGGAARRTRVPPVVRRADLP
jgi:hypothetical protein